MGMAYVPMDKPGPDDPVTPGYRRPVEDVVDDVMGAKNLDTAVIIALGGADGRKFPEVERIGNALVKYVREAANGVVCSSSTDSESPSDLAHGPEV